MDTLTLLCFQSEVLSSSLSLAKLLPRTGLLFTALKGVAHVTRVTQLSVMARGTSRLSRALTWSWYLFSMPNLISRSKKIAKQVAAENALKSLIQFKNPAQAQVI